MARTGTGVAHWFASLIGKLPATGVVPLDEWWENWSTSANPQISPELVIAGRQDQAKRIARWFQDKPSHYYVQGHTREEAVQTIYTDLFSMFHRHQRLGENFEIVFGLGFLNWKSPDGQTVRRHLTVAHVSVEFDRESGTLTVTPRARVPAPHWNRTCWTLSIVPIRRSFAR